MGLLHRCIRARTALGRLGTKSEIASATSPSLNRRAVSVIEGGCSTCLFLCLFGSLRSFFCEAPLLVLRTPPPLSPPPRPRPFPLACADFRLPFPAGCAAACSVLPQEHATFESRAAEALLPLLPSICADPGETPAVGPRQPSGCRIARGMASGWRRPAPRGLILIQLPSQDMGCTAVGQMHIRPAPRGFEVNQDTYVDIAGMQVTERIVHHPSCHDHMCHLPCSSCTRGRRPHIPPFVESALYWYMQFLR